MASLSNLKAPKNSRSPKKRVGRGQGSGLGKTAGRGGKGQKARTGNMHFEGFEGGQSPLQRRLPKFGFKNFFRKEFAEINIGDLEAFDAGATVDLDALENAGLVKVRKDGLKVLGNGELTKALTVRAARFSASARAAIEKAGGKAETVETARKPLPTRGQGSRARLAAARAAKRQQKTA
ncbi:MAG: 50S ribosomal protein L15 [Myxococcales bacterium]